MADERDAPPVDEQRKKLSSPSRSRPFGRSYHDADKEAKRRWGPLGVAFSGMQYMVGKYDRSPDHWPPPWPIAVYGAGEDFDEAFAQADEGEF